MKALTFIIENENENAKRFNELDKTRPDYPTFPLKWNQRGKLKSCLMALSPDSKVYILFHVGVKGDRSRYPGETTFYNYSEYFPGLLKKSYFFSKLATKIDIPNAKSIYHLDLEKIYKDESEVEPYTPYELLNGLDGLSYAEDLTGNSYNYWLFTQLVEEETMKKVLSNVFPEGAKDILIRVLTPGFSGAQVLGIKYKLNDYSRSLILKMNKAKWSLENELKLANDATYCGLKNMKVLVATSKEIKQVYDWYFLTYKESENKKALKDLLNLSESKLKKIYANIITSDLADFNKELGRFEVIDNTNCWISRKTNEYTGLVIYKSTQLNIAREVEHIFKKAGKTIGILKKDKDKIIEFVQNGKLGGTFIDNQTYVPVSRVHGDLHTSNILTDDKGQNFTIIDYGLTNEKNTSHAFLDLAKLALDTEMNIISDDLFLLHSRSKTNLNNWIQLHQIWLKKVGTWTFDKSMNIWKADPNADIMESYKKNKSNKAIRKAYRMNDYVLSNLNPFVEQTANSAKVGVSVDQVQKDLTLQFLIVRLQFLLKYISYNNIQFEKRAFALKASLDTFDFIVAQK